MPFDREGIPHSTPLVIRDSSGVSTLDSLDRLMKKETEQATENRLSETLSSVLRTQTWKHFLAGTLQPTGGFSNAEIASAEFSKKVESNAEVEVSLVLSCVTISKGLPPFFNIFCGHRMRFNGETKRYETLLVVDRVEGRTFREYLGRTFQEYISSRDESLLKDVRYQLQSIFVQVCVALSSAQKYVGFVHNDFHCENIMIQKQWDGDAMVFRTMERCYRFPEDTPRVRIIDYGQSSVVHPVHHRTVHSFTGLMTQGMHGVDVARFCLRVVKWAQEVSRRDRFGGDWSAVLGDELTEDFCAVLRHLTSGGPATPRDIATHAASINDNAEWYPFDVGVSPARILSEGACVRRFTVASPREARCAFWRNLYVERPEDVFDSSAAVYRFSSTEKKSFPVVRIPLSRWVVCDTDAIVRNVHAALKHHMTCRGFMAASGAARHDDSTAYKIKNSDGTERCRALYFQKTDERTKRRVAWRALVVFQKSILLYIIAFVAENSQEAEGIRNELRSKLETNVPRQNREEILLALCCYANTGDFSFFEDAELTLLTNQGHVFRDIEGLRSLRKKIMKVRDRVEFGKKGEGGGLFVDAQKMTHEEVYANKCLKKLFYTSSCTSFYVSAFVS